jgi:hypothetical protein
MSTWDERFKELSASHATAWEELKRAREDQDQKRIAIAESKVKTTIQAISRFHTKYKEAGSPNHDKEMPD